MDMVEYIPLVQPGMGISRWPTLTATGRCGDSRATIHFASARAGSHRRAVCGWDFNPATKAETAMAASERVEWRFRPSPDGRQALSMRRRCDLASGRISLRGLVTRESQNGHI